MTNFSFFQEITHTYNFEDSQFSYICFLCIMMYSGPEPQLFDGQCEGSSL